MPPRSAQLEYFWANHRLLKDKKGNVITRDTQSSFTAFYHVNWQDLYKILSKLFYFYYMAKKENVFLREHPVKSRSDKMGPSCSLG